MPSWAGNARLLPGIREDPHRLAPAEPHETGCRLARGRRPPTAATATPAAAAGQPAAGVTQTPALDQFTINLTERASKGEIDPVIGRESEIRQMVDILIRRRQNNPILTGEAGVGKTAVVEGLARRIAEGESSCARRMSPFVRWTWDCCRPAPGSRGSSRTGSSR